MRRPKGLSIVYVNLECLCKHGFVCVVGPAAPAQRYIAWRLSDKTILAEPPENYGRGRFFYRNGYWPAIWIPRWPRTPAEYGALAHEVSHVLFAVLDHIGETPDYKHDEVFCHLLSYGVAKILEAKR
jgi:hypothetical protein